MSFLCWFMQCERLFRFNAPRHWHRPSNNGIGLVGVYQCSRCKTLSVGAPRE